MKKPWVHSYPLSPPSEDSDQPGHPPSLIRVFKVRMKKPLVLSYPLSAEQRLLSDWADAQADLSLSWAHTHFVGLVMSRLISIITKLSVILYWIDLKTHRMLFPTRRKIVKYFMIICILLHFFSHICLAPVSMVWEDPKSALKFR